MNGKKRNGRNVLHAWRLPVVLFGSAVGLVSVPAVAVAQNWSQHEIDDVVNGVSGIWDNSADMVDFLEGIAGDVQDLVNTRQAGSLDPGFWTNAVKWTRSTSYNANPGLRRDLFDWLSGVPTLTNVFHTSSDKLWIENPEGTYGFLPFYDELFPVEQYYTQDFTEFLALTMGQNVDSRGFNDFYHVLPNGILAHAGTLDEAWEVAFNPWKSGSSYIGDMSFFSVWQAEALRRQLFALGAATNSWDSFTNSAVIASTQGILGTPDEMGYGVSNVVESFDELTTTNQGPSVISMIGETFRLPTVSPTFYGTNELEETVKEISPSLNLVTNLQSGLYSSIQIAPPDNLGGLNFQARFQGIPQMDRVEVDLNGGLADQSLQRVKRFVHLLLGFAFLVFQIVESVRTLFYIMRLDDGQSRSASI